MLQRLLGTETEYAIRFTPGPGVVHPGNEALYDAIREAVEGMVHTRPGQGLIDGLRRRVFTENGGSLYYEYVPRAQQGGLVEAGTPECRGPGQLLLYQRAQDRLLGEAVARASASLARQGISGELALLKNCRDAEGNVYGAQESYEVEIASGAALLAWRLGVCLIVPAAAAIALLHWALLLSLGAIALAAALAALVLVVAAALWGREPEEALAYGAWWPRSMERLGAVEMGFAYVTMLLPALWMASLARLCAFRPHRRGMAAFLASRCVLSGAGTLQRDGALHLSEKAGAIRRWMRWTVLPGDRGMLEIGHLIKPLHALAWLDLRSVARLLRSRQRLQLGLSDANLCDVAELLKLGTTALVADLVEAGRAEGLPQPVDPAAAARILSADPTLTATVPLRGGGEATALQLQRAVLERVESWLAEAPAVGLEATEIAGLWRRTLDAIEQEPEELVGRLDWITKRALLDGASDLPWEARKKIDLRYHELKTGYHAWLDASGLVLRVVSDEEAERACREPPPSTPARHRGRLVRELSLSGTAAAVGWEDVRIGGPVRGKVIELSKYRSERDPS